MSHVVSRFMLFILRSQRRVVKEWGILSVSCRAQFKAWITLNFGDIINSVLLILLLIVFCL